MKQLLTSLLSEAGSRLGLDSIIIHISKLFSLCSIVYPMPVLVAKHVLMRKIGCQK